MCLKEGLLGVVIRQGKAYSDRVTYRLENEMTESGYNGWTNYETWCVNLWLSNDEALYNLVTELVADFEDEAPMHEIADAVKDFVEELEDVTQVRERASFVSDLLGAALSEVDWYEIAEVWVSDQVTA